MTSIYTIRRSSGSACLLLTILGYIPGIIYAVYVLVA
jgi:hypothetical protein